MKETLSQLRPLLALLVILVVVLLGVGMLDTVRNAKCQDIQTELEERLSSLEYVLEIFYSPLEDTCLYVYARDPYTAHLGGEGIGIELHRVDNDLVILKSENAYLDEENEKFYILVDQYR